MSEFTAFAVPERYLKRTRDFRMFGRQCMRRFHNNAALKLNKFGHKVLGVAGQDIGHDAPGGRRSANRRIGELVTERGGLRGENLNASV
jgi:hypothetical protein